MYFAAKHVMIYTTKERNNAALLIAAGKADLTDIPPYERLEEFKAIHIIKKFFSRKA